MHLDIVIVKKFKGFEKAPLFILSLYIVEFGYSGQIWPSGKVPLYRGLTLFGHREELTFLWLKDAAIEQKCDFHKKVIIFKSLLK